MSEQDKIFQMVDVIVDNFVPFRGAKMLREKPPREIIARMIDSVEHIKLFARMENNARIPRQSGQYFVFVLLSLGSSSSDLPKRLRNCIDLGAKRGRDATNTFDIPENSRVHFYVIGDQELIDKYKIQKVISDMNKQVEGYTYRLYPYRNFIMNIPANSQVPKFRLITEEELANVLKLGFLSKQELPSVVDSDATVVWAGGEIGDCVLYERYSPNVGVTTVVRRVVKTPATVKNAGDVDDKVEDPGEFEDDYLVDDDDD